MQETTHTNVYTRIFTYNRLQNRLKHETYKRSFFTFKFRALPELLYIIRIHYIHSKAHIPVNCFSYIVLITKTENTKSV